MNINIAPIPTKVREITIELVVNNKMINITNNASECICVIGMSSLLFLDIVFSPLFDFRHNKNTEAVSVLLT